MAKNTSPNCCEQFKTVIGGQALIEGIMMRGPEKDAVVVRGKDGVSVEVTRRKLPQEKSLLRWPLIRGIYNFFDAQVTGVKSLMHSADLAPDEEQVKEETSKFDQWLEKKLGDEKFQKYVIGAAVAMGMGLSILLFFLLPMVVVSFFDRWIGNNLVLNLLEGLVRISVFMGYIILVSRMQEMKRLFAYHGAEHKTIRCYEAGLPLTVENVRQMSRLHPRCGTSFLLVVMILSILVFSAASTVLLSCVPALAAIQGTVGYKVIMIAFKLLLIPLVVAISYEINRWVGRHDNLLTKILTTPGMWFQKFTTNEPDDSMIEIGIMAVEAVLPEKEGSDRW